MEANSSDRLAGDLPVLNKWTCIGALFGITSAVVYNGLQRRPAIASKRLSLINIRPRSKSELGLG